MGCRDAVQRCVGDGDPRSEEAVRAVGERYGVGRVTAINRLCQVYDLERSTREQMLERASTPWPAGPHPDQENVRIGLRSGVLAERALEAFGRGLIDRVEVRRYLGLSLTDALPDALSEAHGVEPERRTPVRSVEQQVLAKASAFLSAHRVGHLAPLRPRRTEQGWEVDIEGAEDPRTLALTFELDVVDPPPWLAM